MKVTKSVLIAVIAFVAALVMASPASAVAAKFHSVDSSVTNSGALVVSFDERGLGNGNIDYMLSAESSAVYACINGGGKHPQAANKETVNGDVSAAGSFESRNGRVQASLSAGPISAGDFSLPRRPAPRARLGLLLEHRPDRHDERHQRLGARHVAGLLRRLRRLETSSASCVWRPRGLGGVRRTTSCGGRHP